MSHKHLDGRYTWGPSSQAQIIAHPSGSEIGALKSKEQRNRTFFLPSCIGEINDFLSKDTDPSTHCGGPFVTRDWFILVILGDSEGKMTVTMLQLTRVMSLPAGGAEQQDP